MYIFTMIPPYMSRGPLIFPSHFPANVCCNKPPEESFRVVYGTVGLGKFLAFGKESPQKMVQGENNQVSLVQFINNWI